MPIPGVSYEEVHSKCNVLDSRINRLYKIVLNMYKEKYDLKSISKITNYL